MHSQANVELVSTEREREREREKGGGKTRYPVTEKAQILPICLRKVRHLRHCDGSVRDGASSCFGGGALRLGLVGPSDSSN